MRLSLSLCVTHMLDMNTFIQASKVACITRIFQDLISVLSRWVLESEKLPQWSFVTPNLVNDGHDTDIRHLGIVQMN